MVRGQGRSIMDRERDKVEGERKREKRENQTSVHFIEKGWNSEIQYVLVTQKS